MKTIVLLILVLLSGCESRKTAPTSSKNSETIKINDYEYKINRSIFSDEIKLINDQIKEDKYIEVISTWDKQGANNLQEYAHHRRESKEDFFKVMLTVNGGIDTIYYNKSEKSILLFISGNNLEGNLDFYNLQKSLPFEGDYYKYHDIYSSLFSYPDIENIRIYDAHYKEFVSRLPSVWDGIMTLQCDVMKKEWYIKDLDYHLLIDNQTVKCDSLSLILSTYLNK